jgi:glutamyl endopeptidase
MSNQAPALAPAAPTPAARLRQPALRVSKGQFGDPENPEWEILDTHRDEIQARLPSVGRIRQGPFVLGTGILVARNVVLTNAHVARAFTTDVDDVAKIRVGWKPVIDFIGEEPLVIPAAHDSHAGAAAQQSPAQTPAPKPHDHVHQPHEDEPCGCCRIRSAFYIDKDHDLALLRVAFDDAKSPETWHRPRPMALNASPDLIRKEQQIYLIGFPGDDRTATREEVEAVIGTHFGVKHVQPGVILELTTGDRDQAEFVHDASTLKGNSGSCVVDVTTNQLIGLHTRGSREAAGEVSFNRAIAFSRLSPDLLDRLRKAGVEVIGADTPAQTA